MKRVRILLTAGLATLAGAAQANRPLTTDTADVIERGQCQFEPYFTSNRSSGAASQRLSVLQLNCGVPHDTQLGAAWGTSSSDGSSTYSLTLAGKTNLIELKDDQTGIGVNYGLSTLKEPDASWSRDGSFVSLIVSRQWREGLLVHANLGWSRSRLARQDSTLWAAAVEWTATPQLTLSAETYGDDRTRPWVSAGAVWTANRAFNINAALAVQTATPRVRQVTAGFNWQF
jgi:hypothetical protein